jgi:hypothetical protein
MALGSSSLQSAEVAVIRSVGKVYVFTPNTQAGKDKGHKQRRAHNEQVEHEQEFDWSKVQHLPPQTATTEKGSQARTTSEHKQASMQNRIMLTRQAKSMRNEYYQ